MKTKDIEEGKLYAFTMERGQTLLPDKVKIIDKRLDYLRERGWSHRAILGTPPHRYYESKALSSLTFRSDAACLLVELMARGRREKSSIKPDDRFKGARPQDIIMLWSDWEKQVAQRKKEEAESKERQKDARKKREHFRIFQAKRLRKLGIKEDEPRGFHVSYDDKISLTNGALVRLLDLAEKGPAK